MQMWPFPYAAWTNIHHTILPYVDNILVKQPQNPHVLIALTAAKVKNHFLKKFCKGH